MPTDNAAWKARCDALHHADPTARGVIPASFVTASGTVPGPQWTEFGWDRSRADQSAVACVFFYLGAIADHHHNAGHADRVHTKESAVSGLIEWKLLHGQQPTASEKLTHEHAKLAEIPKPALTVQAEQAMIDTADTLPLGSPQPLHT